MMISYEILQVLFLNFMCSCHSGITKFMGNFSFNRKRNIVELDISQEIGKGYQKYVVRILALKSVLLMILYDIAFEFSTLCVSRN